MIHRMKFLELAADSMDLLGVTAAGWYLGAKYQDRARRDADRKLTALHQDRPRPFDEPPAAVSLLSEPGLSLGPLSADIAGDDDVETGAEELLAARIGRFGDPFFGIIVGWWQWIWRRLMFIGWLRVPLLAPVGLALFVLLIVLVALYLPFIIVGFLLDTDKDFRLRIIVLAFALGIGLQITNALTG
jgi:hypothetical protein